MTTAHRPTFYPAVGGTGKNEGDLAKLSKQYSSKDMPSHTKVKYRQPGQGTTDELKTKDFRKELEEREKSTSSRDKRSRDTASSSVAGSIASSSTSKKPRLDQVSGNLDADDPLDDDDEEQESEDDEDDTAELMAELARIKKEREAEKQKLEAQKAAEDEKIRVESILQGNPLLSGSGAGAKQDFKVKRRWDDDVVFKNCAKGLDDKKKEATFINDALRSEFHKKFMDKYIK